jgi:hypothetical protein
MVPIRMRRVGVKKGEVAVRELHHDLATNVSPITWVVRPPSVGKFCDGFFQRRETGE